MNIIIFGGAFDPIHNGHMNMAIKAQKTLNGEVFFVPAPISVWKDSSAPIEDKINMLELAIKGYKHFHIDRFEADSGKDVNYSIDTVKHYKELYPNDNLYFLIGTDQVNKFHKWKDASLLAQLSQIIFYDRPDEPLQNENIEKFHMQRIEGDGIVVSSTDYRELKSLKVPDEVLYYIGEHRLYNIKTMQNYISEKRLDHCLSVAKLAYEIAKSNKLDHPHRYYAAALFHDVGKLRDVERERKIVEEFYPEYSDMPEFSYHQFVSAYIAEKEFGVTDPSMLNAIKFHATGNDNMDIMAKIVYAADKIEPTRGFDSTELIKAMMDDAESGFIIVLKANKEFLEKNRGDINNSLTSKCFRKYLG